MSTNMDEDQELNIEFDGISLRKVTNFKYVRSITQSLGDFDRETVHRFHSG